MSNTRKNQDHFRIQIIIFSFLQVTIDDLIPGSRYKFRIKSENNYGISNPGDESDPFDVGGVTSDRSVKSCFIRICVLIL